MGRLNDNGLLPFPSSTQHWQFQDNSRAGVRERLRREASRAIRVDDALKAEGAASGERTRALEMPWLDTLFDTPVRLRTWLNPRSMADVAHERLDTPGVPESVASLASEIGLMEAIQQHRAMMQVSVTPRRPGLARQQRERRWASLRRLLEAWEITLRA